MNRIYLIGLLVVCGVIAFFSFEKNETTPEIENVVIEDYVPAAGEHYVKVVLPNEEKSLQATLTLSMEGRSPEVYTFPAEAKYSDTSPLSYRFIVAEPLSPATLKVAYSNGEEKTMSQVIFDTMIRTP